MTNWLTPKAPMPPSLGGCVDLYHDVRELRLKMEAEIKELKSRETEIQEHLIDNISKANVTGVAGQRYRAQVSSVEKFNASDWGVIHSMVNKHGLYNLLGKSLNQGEVKTWCDEQQRLFPGVERIWVPRLSVTKIPGT